jgi:hypothetical protein
MKGIPRFSKHARTLQSLILNKSRSATSPAHLVSLLAYSLWHCIVHKILNGLVLTSVPLTLEKASATSTQ